VVHNIDTVFEEENQKRRTVPDRRRGPTPILSRYTLRGQRKDVRRDEDRRRHIYVDQYSLRFFLLLMAILLLGTADAFLTLYHVHVNNAEELNPIMDFFLGIGPKMFFNVKYILTALCLTVLCTPHLFRDRHEPPLPFRADLVEPQSGTASEFIGN